MNYAKLCKIATKSGIPRNEFGQKALRQIWGELYNPLVDPKIYQIEMQMMNVANSTLLPLNTKILNWTDNYLRVIRKSVASDIEKEFPEEDFFIPLIRTLTTLGPIITDYTKLTLAEKGVDLTAVSLSSKIDFNLPPQFTDFLVTREKYLAKTLKKTTLNKLKRILKAGIKDGLSYADIAESIKVSLGMNVYRAEMIARTETNWAMNEGTRQHIKRLGVKKYQISSASKACPICLEKAKNVYNIKEKDVLPIHPNCRCVMISVIPKEWLE